MILTRADLPKLLISMDLPLIGAEIGVADGSFSRDLLVGGFTKLYSIDFWGRLPQTGDGGYNTEWHNANYASALTKLTPFPGSVILRGKSADMAKEISDNELSLLYIDGDHSYKGVLSDLVAYYPKVRTNGIIAGHDYLNRDYGVYDAVADFCLQYSFTPIIIPENSPTDSSFYLVKK